MCSPALRIPEEQHVQVDDPYQGDPPQREPERDPANRPIPQLWQGRYEEQDGEESQQVPREPRRLHVLLGDEALLLERQAMARERLTFEECSEPRVRAMRERLFSRSKSHGGLFKKVIDGLDSVLFRLLA